VPDRVHVLAYGQIRRSGSKELALELEEGGYVGVLGGEFADQRAAAVVGA
jgi:Fe-S cluster assembly ATP-binding protein